VLYIQHLAELSDGGANLYGFRRSMSIPRPWITRPNEGDKLTGLQSSGFMRRCRSGLRRDKNRKLRGHRKRRGGGDRFSGRIRLNGLLPSPGPVTRTVEGDDRCGAARVAGVTLRGAGFAGDPPIGPTALGECACWEFAGFGAFRANSPVEPLRLASGLSESVGDRGVIVKDGPIGPKRVAESSGRALRD